MSENNCYLCQEPKSVVGHSTKSCPSVKCKKSGQKGHILRNCPKLNLNMDQKPNANVCPKDQVLSNSLEKLKLPPPTHHQHLNLPKLEDLYLVEASQPEMTFFKFAGSSSNTNTARNLVQAGIFISGGAFQSKPTFWGALRPKSTLCGAEPEAKLSSFSFRDGATVLDIMILSLVVHV